MVGNQLKLMFGIVTPNCFVFTFNFPPHDDAGQWRHLAWFRLTAENAKTPQNS